MFTFFTRNHRASILPALIIAVCGFVGMIDSFYLVLEYLQVLLHPGEPTPCTVNSLVSCTLTVQGPWGHVVPSVPNPLFGMLWYSGVTGYGVTRLLGSAFSRKARAFVGSVFFLGLVFSYTLYLASVLALGGVCPFCLASTTASTLIVLAFCIDDAGYSDALMKGVLRNFFTLFQVFSFAVFVIGLPLFFIRGLQLIPQPMSVVTHWSFPVIVALVLIMAGGHVWAYRAMRGTK